MVLRPAIPGHFDIMAASFVVRLHGSASDHLPLVATARAACIPGGLHACYIPLLGRGQWIASERLTSDGLNGGGRLAVVIRSGESAEVPRRAGRALHRRSCAARVPDAPRWRPRG